MMQFHRRLISLGVTTILPVAMVAAGIAARSAIPVFAACSWGIVASPNVGTGSNLLRGVAATSASDVWAVGEYSKGTIPQTLIEHRGSGWAVVPSPNVGAAENHLEAVTALTPTNAWADGYYLSGGTGRTLIEHWDGKTWKVVSSPNPGTGNLLFGLAAVSATNIWAVGYEALSSRGPNQTLILHWDGTSWKAVPSPNVANANNFLNGVGASAATDVWAVGEARGTSLKHTLIEHWGNGGPWKIVSSPNPGTTLNVLRSVSAPSSTRAWAVGDTIKSIVEQTLIEQWSGSAWSTAGSANAGSGNRNHLYGVAAVSGSNGWAVGDALLPGPGDTSFEQTLIEHSTGGNWTIVASPNQPGSNNYLRGVTVTPGASSKLWTVGYYRASGPNKTLTMSC